MQRDGAPALIHSAARRNDVVGVERGEIEALAENKDIAGKIARAASDWLVMTTGARVGFRPGDAIIIARKNERRIRIGQWRSGTLGQRAPGAFLAREMRIKEFLAVGDQIVNRYVELFTILQMMRNSDFAADVSQRFGVSCVDEA